MSPRLVVALAVTGGSPPPTQEVLRVYDDGRAVALVGNAWPEGTPLDEAGVYQTVLPPAEIDALVAVLAERHIGDLAPEYGPRRADSGVTTVVVPAGASEQRIRWGAFADVPEALGDLRRRLRGLLSEVRRWPVQAVQVAVEIATDRLVAGQAFPVAVVLTNRGRQPVRVSLTGAPGGAGDSVRLHVAPAGEARPTAAPPLAIIQAARPVALVGPATSAGREQSVALTPGGTWRLTATAPAITGPPGAYWLYAFAEAQLQVVVDDRPLTLGCFVAAWPIALTVAPA
jgi:hypothetical protein